MLELDYNTSRSFAADFAYIYPSINIVGPFTFTRSKGSNVLLRPMLLLTKSVSLFKAMLA